MNKKAGFSKNGHSSSARQEEPIEHLNHAPVGDKPSRGDVASNVYFIYLKEGREHGQDVRHWWEAEAQLK